MRCGCGCSGGAGVDVVVVQLQMWPEWSGKGQDMTTAIVGAVCVGVLQVCIGVWQGLHQQLVQCVWVCCKCVLV